MNNFNFNQPFHVREGRAAGMSQWELRTGPAEPLFRGMRSPKHPESLFDRCYAYLVVMGSGSYFSHVTAAQLWGMWLPRRLYGSPLHVSAPMPARAPRMSGVIGHKGADAVDVQFFREFPVASPVDSWRQLSQYLSLDELVAAGDSLVRRENPLLTFEQLSVALARHGAHRGIARLRAAHLLVRPRCDSPRETTLRLAVFRSHLPEPEVNAMVSKPGERVRFGDLVFPRWKVIAEYDGSHHFTPKQLADDIERLEQLAREGWTVVRVLAAHLDDPARIIARIEQALRDNGWR